jgi:hypothetical protein
MSRKMIPASRAGKLSGKKLSRASSSNLTTVLSLPGFCHPKRRLLPRTIYGTVRRVAQIAGSFLFMHIRMGQTFVAYVGACEASPPDHSHRECVWLAHWISRDGKTCFAPIAQERASWKLSVFSTNWFCACSMNAALRRRLTPSPQIPL